MVPCPTVPWFSEYSEDGKLLHEVQFGQIDGRAEHDHSYRVYKVRSIALVPETCAPSDRRLVQQDAWVGRPTTNPSLVLDQKTWTTAFVSWNGATEHASWRLFSGANPEELKALLDSDGAHISYDRTGFETELELPPLSSNEAGSIRYLAVVAYDRYGVPLGGSEIIDRETGDGTGFFVDLDSVRWAMTKRHYGAIAFAAVSLFPELAGNSFAKHANFDHAPLIGTSRWRRDPGEAKRSAHPTPARISSLLVNLAIERRLCRPPLARKPRPSPVNL